jgi:hypothetical protein
VDADGVDDGTMHAGRFVLDVPVNRLPLATAAPGIQ